MSTNDKPVIAVSLVQYWQIVYAFSIFCFYFIWLNANKFAKYEKLVKYLPYYTRQGAITSTYLLSILGSS